MKKHIFFFLVLSGIMRNELHAQNVGIGTLIPQRKLHVSDTVGSRIITLFENRSPAGNGSIIALRSTNGTVPEVWYLGSGIYGIGQHKFGIGGLAQRLVIDDNTGNVGIGNDNPISKLSNSDINIAGSDGIGVSSSSITWGMNAQGYVQSLYNAETISGGNGLAVKIAGNAGSNRLLDLSVGATSPNPGTPVMVVLGNGKVGVNTNSPYSNLSNFNTNIKGSDGIGVSPPSITWGMNAQGYVQSLFNAETIFGGNGLAVKIAGNTSSNRLLDLSVGSTGPIPGTPVMIVQGDGKVGIGSNNPFTSLSNFNSNIISSDGIGVSSPSIAWGMNAQGYVQSLFNSGAVDGGNGLAVKIAGNTGNNRLLDLSVGASASTQGTPVMIVQGDGKVGIGTNYPGAKLSFGTSWPEQRALSLFDDYANNNAFGMGVEANPATGGSRMMIYSGTSNATDAVTLGSYGGTIYNETMRVQANGLVGIGTTTPQSRLHIAGNGPTNQIQIDDASGVVLKLNAYFNQATGPLPYVGTASAHSFSVVTNNAYRMFFDGGTGNVGIGTLSPASRLHVNGTITATAPLNVVSDVRYKKDIMPLKNAVNTVLQLKGVSYRLRGDEFPEMNFPAAMQIGFIAQEVEKVVPAIVTTDKTGSKSVSYTSVIPLLVEAIKEQQQQIDSLKRLVEELVKSKQ